MTRRHELTVVFIAACIYLAGLMTPPHLMDDVDAAESLQAKNMLVSGDWITQHLNGTVYIDKAPLKYWITAGLYSIFGIHDWVARILTAFSAITLCWLVVRMGIWAGAPKAGFYSGLVLSTSIGLFLFTRTVIPDIVLTLLITLSLYSFLRLLESDRPARWAFGMWASIGLAVLTKGFIGVVFPVGIAVVYLVVTRQITSALTWRKLYTVRGTLLFLAIAAPWHVMATLHNPPLLDLTLHAGPAFGGKFRGFFWFYFINEQVLRFLNERWPRDYNTVPRLWFWLYHILWFFPWSFFLPAIFQLPFKLSDRAGKMRVLLLCWIGLIMLFFTFSTTQEYYSMPIYPALALLLGWAMATPGKWYSIATRTTAAITLAAAAVIVFILINVWSLPTPGDIYSALSQHPSLYTLSLGHMADLTLPAFAYLRLPLAVAGVGLLLGGLGVIFVSGERAYLAIAVMLLVFFQAARLALIAFDPYLSSYAVAQKLNQLPKGLVVLCGKYNPLSSVFFYSEDKARQNEPDLDILEYGALAPGAPKLLVEDSELKQLWGSENRVYIISKAPKLDHLYSVLGKQGLSPIFKSGDKYLFANKQGN